MTILNTIGSCSWGAERDGKTQSSSHERVWRQWGTILFSYCFEIALYFCNHNIAMYDSKIKKRFQDSTKHELLMRLSLPFLLLPWPPSSLLRTSLFDLYLPLPLPSLPSSSLVPPLLFSRTCKWRSITLETLRQWTYTSEGRRWQRWWALSLLSSRRTDTESLACSSSGDSTIISLTLLTSLVSHVMSHDLIWCHVVSCDVIWARDLIWPHVMSCELMMSCGLWCHVTSCDVTWPHVMSCELEMPCGLCDVMWSRDVMISRWKLWNFLHFPSKKELVCVNLKILYKWCDLWLHEEW